MRRSLIRFDSDVLRDALSEHGSSLPRLKSRVRTEVVLCPFRRKAFWVGDAVLIPLAGRGESLAERLGARELISDIVRVRFRVPKALHLKAGTYEVSNGWISYQGVRLGLTYKNVRSLPLEDREAKKARVEAREAITLTMRPATVRRRIGEIVDGLRLFVDNDELEILGSSSSGLQGTDTETLELDFLPRRKRGNVSQRVLSAYRAMMPRAGDSLSYGRFFFDAQLMGVEMTSNWRRFSLPSGEECDVAFRPEGEGRLNGQFRGFADQFCKGTIISLPEESLVALAEELGIEREAGQWLVGEDCFKGKSNPAAKGTLMLGVFQDFQFAGNRAQHSVTMGALLWDQQWFYDKNPSFVGLRDRMIRRAEDQCEKLIQRYRKILTDPKARAGHVSWVLGQLREELTDAEGQRQVQWLSESGKTTHRWLSELALAIAALGEKAFKSRSIKRALVAQAERKVISTVKNLGHTGFTVVASRLLGPQEQRLRAVLDASYHPVPDGYEIVVAGDDETPKLGMFSGHPLRDIPVPVVIVPKSWARMPWLPQGWAAISSSALEAMDRDCDGDVVVLTPDREGFPVSSLCATMRSETERPIPAKREGDDDLPRVGERIEFPVKGKEFRAFLADLLSFGADQIGAATNNMLVVAQDVRNPSYRRAALALQVTTSIKKERLNIFDPSSDELIPELKPVKCWSRAFRGGDPWLKEEEYRPQNLYKTLLNGLEQFWALNDTVEDMPDEGFWAKDLEKVEGLSDPDFFLGKAEEISRRIRGLFGGTLNPHNALRVWQGIDNKKRLSAVGTGVIPVALRPLAKKNPDLGEGLRLEDDGYQLRLVWSPLEAEESDNSG